MTQDCYGGVEIKAHATANAAQDVHIDGHISIRDVRSYHWRHIGHHLGYNYDTNTPGDPVSVSAFDITASNLVSIFPGNRLGFQEDTSPSALNISAYVNVSVTNFTAIGDPAYDFAGENVVTLKYQTNNVSLKNMNIRNFKGSGVDIYVTGGFNKADRITIDGVNVKNSSPTVIGVGTLNPMVSISNVNAVAPATGAQYGIDAGWSTSNIHITDTLNLVGYPTQIRYNSTNYATADRYFRRTTDVPSGVTRMLDLDPTMDYYASTSAFAAFGTDRPAPAASAGGGYWITHSRLTADSTIQTLTRNTSSTSQAQYWRVMNFSTKTAGAWNQQSITAVAYSTS
jgi:hypothetical protein